MADALGAWLLAPLGVLPGYVSATIVGVVTGVLLIVFKYTSYQTAISACANGINADLLLSNYSRTARRSPCKRRGAARRRQLLVLAADADGGDVLAGDADPGSTFLVVSATAVAVGEEAVVTLQLNGDADVTLRPSDAVETTAGPLRIPSQRAVAGTSALSKMACTI